MFSTLCFALLLAAVVDPTVVDPVALQVQRSFIGLTQLRVLTRKLG